MVEHELEILSEFGARSDAPIQRVLRAHYLQMIDPAKGPTQIVNPGQLVRLTPGTQEENFFINRIDPLQLPEQFKCIRPFRTVENELYVDVCEGDEIELERDEALFFMRQHRIKPIFSAVPDGGKEK